MVDEIAAAEISCRCDPVMIQPNLSRRSFLKTSAALVGISPLTGLPQTKSSEPIGPLVAYVGTFSSPLRDTLPTQVDLPPGNGRGIHLFHVDRSYRRDEADGRRRDGHEPELPRGQRRGNAPLFRRMKPTGLGTTNRAPSAPSPSIGPTGIWSSSTPCAPAARVPPYVSMHPGGRHLLVANYFGGSVAVLPILADGRLGDASDVKVDAGTIGPNRATHAPPGSFAVSGHDRTHAHMIQADPSGRFVLHADLGLDKIFVWRFDDQQRRAGPERSAVDFASSWRRTAAFPFPPERPLVLFDSGGRLYRRAVRLRLGVRTLERAADHLHAAARVCRQEFLLRDPGFFRRALRVRRQPAARQHRDLLGGPDGRLTFVGEEWTRGDYPRSFAFDPTGRFLYCCNQRAMPSPSSAWIARPARLSFTGHYAAVGNPSRRPSGPRVGRTFAAAEKADGIYVCW